MTLIYGRVRLVLQEERLREEGRGPRPSDLSDTGEGVSFPGAGGISGTACLCIRSCWREFLSGASRPAQRGLLRATGCREAQTCCLNQASRVLIPGFGLPPPPAPLCLHPESRNWERPWEGWAWGGPLATLCLHCRGYTTKPQEHWALNPTRLPRRRGPWVGGFPGQARGWYAGLPTVPRASPGRGLPYCGPEMVCTISSPERQVVTGRGERV